MHSSDLTLGINPKTAHKWLSNNQELPRKRGGKMSKQTNEKITRVITAIEKKQLAEIVHNEFDVVVCINTIKIWLGAKLFTLKKKTPQSNQQNEFAK